MNHAKFTAATPPVDHGLRDGSRWQGGDADGTRPQSATPITDERGGRTRGHRRQRPASDGDRSGRAVNVTAVFRQEIRKQDLSSLESSLP